MPVSFFGNTNNYPYLLVKGFLENGIEARLVVNRREPLHRPEFADPELARGYPEWIFDCSDLLESDFAAESPRIGPVLNYLEYSDFAVMNHIGPSIAKRVGLPYLCALTGSDVTYYADQRTPEIRTRSWSEQFRTSPSGLLDLDIWTRFVERQRAGIAHCRALSFSPRGWDPAGDRVLDSLGIADDRRFTIYLCDTKALAPSRPKRRSTLRVLNGARLNWCKPLPEGFTSLDDKGTDILVKGAALFLKQGGRIELRLVEKGLHVLQTRALVESLGIGRHVRWFKELPLAKFRKLMRDSDVVCDQVGPSFPAMTAFEAMALGRPVVGNFRMEWFRGRFGEAPPACQAQSPEEVAAAFDRLAGDFAFREALSESGRRFAETHCSPSASARTFATRLGI